MAGRRRAGDEAPEPVVEETEQVEEPTEAPTSETAPDGDEAPEPVVEADSNASAAEVVLSQFAYANAKDGEVVQLVKGNVVNADHFKPESLEHLRSLGFIGSQD